MQARILPYTPTFVDAEGEPMGGRTGIHLGKVIQYMREGMGDAYTGPSNDGFAQGGFMFEMWVEEALSRYMGYTDKTLIKPGEMEVDGIRMNPDRFRFDPGHKRVVEYKATWKTLRKLVDEDGELNTALFEEKFYYYRWQVMAYCHGLGCRNADIVVWFVNGDYSFRPPSGGPQFRVFEFRFTKEEILSNWSMIRANAEAMRKKGAV